MYGKLVAYAPPRPARRLQAQRQARWLLLALRLVVACPATKCGGDHFGAALQALRAAGPWADGADNMTAAA